MAKADLQEVASRFAELRRHLDAGAPWIDPMAYELLTEIEADVVPRSEAEALAEALETVMPAWGLSSQAALAAYRARHPKETETVTR
jgi:hypothetical protein